MSLMVDANHAYSVPVAKRMAKELEAFDVRWFEEPVVPEDIAGYREVSNNSIFFIPSVQNIMKIKKYRALLTYIIITFSRFVHQHLCQYQEENVASPDLDSEIFLQEVMVHALIQVIDCSHQFLLHLQRNHFCYLQFFRASKIFIQLQLNQILLLVEGFPSS